MNTQRSLRIVRTVTFVLAKVHVAMLLSLPAPAGFLLYTHRSDTMCCRMYLAGLPIIICAAVSDAAARKMQHLLTYLLSCAVAGAGTIAVTSALGHLWLTPALRQVLMLETGLGILFLTVASAGIHMREKRRKKAREENDITWSESTALLEKPSVFGVLFFGGVYLLSLITDCPAFCDLCLTAGILYTMLLQDYRYLNALLEEFAEYSTLTHVPVRRILHQNMLALAVLIVLTGLAAIPAYLTAKHRPYQDIRDWKVEHIISPEDIQFPDQTSGYQDVIPHPDIIKGEPHKPPAWYKPAEYILTALVLLLCAIILLRMIRSYISTFRGSVEENGDIVLSLEEDETIRTKKSRFGKGTVDRALSEQEIIRKHYRRTIQKYRRRANAPTGYETPTQIENGTPFPEDFDIQTLHDTYSRARYGNGTGDGSSSLFWEINEEKLKTLIL